MLLLLLWFDDVESTGEFDVGVAIDDDEDEDVDEEDKGDVVPVVLTTLDEAQVAAAATAATLE